MSKIQYQNITQLEFDTETERTRILKSFTTILGKGKTLPKPKKKKIEANMDVGKIEYF